MNEIWKDVVGYEGLYQVSNLGRVKSLKRIIKADFHFGNTRTYKERILKVGNVRGYQQVNLLDAMWTVTTFIIYKFLLMIRFKI